MLLEGAILEVSPIKPYYRITAWFDNKVSYKMSNKCLQLLLFSVAIGWHLVAPADSLDGASVTSETTMPLSSPAFPINATLPAQYTCDDSGDSPSLSWSGAPEGTKEFVLLMTTPSGPGDAEPIKYNWVMYHIPATTTSLDLNTNGVGTFGVTSDGPDLAYAPPCSQGPGAKEYTFTVYAVNQETSFTVPESEVTGDLVAQAISGTIIGEGSFVESYTRDTEA